MYNKRLNPATNNKYTPCGGKNKGEMVHQTKSPYSLYINATMPPQTWIGCVGQFYPTTFQFQEYNHFDNSRLIH